MHTLLFLLSLWSETSFAGRPVFHTFSLENLVARSHIIAVVEKLPHKEPGECEPLYWPLKVKDLLFVQSKLKRSEGVSKYPAKEETWDEAELKRKAAPGNTVSVLVNETWLFDCTARKSNRSGVSFYAETYSPSSPKAFENGQPFLVFVQMKKGEPTLTTSRAFESLSKKGELLKLLKQ